jgi:tetratricopeptide (TPR) repeat protein
VRARLHVRIVDGLRDSGTGERYPQAIAWHLEHAAQAPLDLDPNDRSLADRAVEALARAGDIARWRIESRTAIDLYERALALAGDEERWGSREARILSTRGEALYWLGRFDDAAAALSLALELAPDDAWTVTHASRFLGDIELNVRSRPDAAAELFDQALASSRELGDAWSEARTLLMGAWVPYWRGDYETTRSMFERALELARANPEDDRWAEARALTSLTSVISPVGDERESLALGQQALDLGVAMRDPFTTAVAQQSVGNSLRRMWRLDEARRHLDQAVRTFHDLGARWEEASTIGDRGTCRRLLGDLRGAEEDFRETARVSRELGERTLMTWTVDRLVLVLVLQGEVARARAELTEALTSIDPADPAFRETLMVSELLVHLAEGDRDTALERAIALLELQRARGLRNEIATATWWVGRVFGADVVGGEAAVDGARAVLESAGWVQFIREPDLLLHALGREDDAATAVSGR